MYKTLIVDDREIFLLELKRMHVWGESSGFEIFGKANNGRLALDLLRESTYDLVITDIRMPIIDGLQLLFEIKKEHLCPCVILLSEYSEFQYARQGIIYGAFDYLVKPAREKELIPLLKRVRKHLDSIPVNKAALLSSSEPEEDIWSYPVSEEKSILNYFKEKDLSLIPLFQNTLDHIYEAMKDNLIKADLMIKKLYHNIISSVYTEYPWLSNYIHIHYFEEIDYIHEGNSDSFKSFYIRKITYLIQFINKLDPAIHDNNLKEIIAYILEHPESDIKLKVMAAKFFTNNTYLSNTFFTKTDIHFNDYITMIKMSRAEYLFKYTDKKIYEISYQLGYKDINYFSKQFKKIYGLNPKEYRNTDISDYQI
ncbi:response regulator [Anaerocolumna sedimenticola]|uniref:Stage 0 sporulation protein A homolog n=1 Tax=Anaerocolumna sedimenticola TaxID=2696063 RepID=A0A6P1TIR2_9FIRM|nr:response regulator [Anaerocolumna sedimenticola]QHQ59999.1 response regulator [Anaerocolumna sedimenticola]